MKAIFNVYEHHSLAKGLMKYLLRGSPKADVKNSTGKQENGTHAQNSKAGIKAIMIPSVPPYFWVHAESEIACDRDHRIRLI